MVPEVAVSKTIANTMVPEFAVSKTIAKTMVLELAVSKTIAKTMVPEFAVSKTMTNISHAVEREKSDLDLEGRQPVLRSDSSLCGK